MSIFKREACSCKKKITLPRWTRILRLNSHGSKLSIGDPDKTRLLIVNYISYAGFLQEVDSYDKAFEIKTCDGAWH